MVKLTGHPLLQMHPKFQFTFIFLRVTNNSLYRDHFLFSISFSTFPAFCLHSGNVQMFVCSPQMLFCVSEPFFMHSLCLDSSFYYILPLPQDLHRLAHHPEITFLDVIPSQPIAPFSRASSKPCIYLYH